MSNESGKAIFLNLKTNIILSDIKTILRNRIIFKNWVLFKNNDKTILCIFYDKNEIDVNSYILNFNKLNFGEISLEKIEEFDVLYYGYIFSNSQFRALNPSAIVKIIGDKEDVIRKVRDLLLSSKESIVRAWIASEKDVYAFAIGLKKSVVDSLISMNKVVERYEVLDVCASN